MTDDSQGGSIIEQLKIIDPLTNPTAHGGRAQDAFHLVIPSLPGHGFSAKPTTTGWDPTRVARAWTVLMKRLGYARFVAQGGDWGAAVPQTMGVQAPAEQIMTTRPQTLYGLTDSPIDLAAFMLDHGDGTGQPGLLGPGPDRRPVRRPDPVRHPGQHLAEAGTGTANWHIR